MTNHILLLASRENVYVGSLLDSYRCTDSEFLLEHDWFWKGEMIHLVEYGHSTIGGRASSDPIQRLVLMMTENLLVLKIKQMANFGEIVAPCLVSTHSDTVLHSVAIEFELFCERCIQSPDFLANLEWGMGWTARREFALSITNKLLRYADVASTLKKVLPVNLVYRGEALVGALRVDRKIENHFLGLLYIASNKTMNIGFEELAGVELTRRVSYKTGNSQELESLEIIVCKITNAINEYEF